MLGMVGCRHLVGCREQWDVAPSGMLCLSPGLSPQLMCFTRFFTVFYQRFPARQWDQGWQEGWQRFQALLWARCWGKQQLRCVGVPLLGDFGDNDNTSLG